MKLAELQRYFAAAATSSSGAILGLEEVFLGSDSLSPSARLGIYNRGYYYRLLDALASVFSETKRVLGDARFEQLGLTYLTEHASEHPAVERVGRKFPEFLRTLGPAPDPVLADVAALEWARLCALVAADPATLARPESLEPARFPDARLRFVASLQCLALDARARRGVEGGAWPTSEPARETGVAVWRPAHALLQTQLEPVEYRALRAALGDAPMSYVCAIFDTGKGQDDEERAFLALRGWFSRHWVEEVDSCGP